MQTDARSSTEEPADDRPQAHPRGGRRDRRRRHRDARPALHPRGRVGRDPADRLGAVGRPPAAACAARRSRSSRSPRSASTASTSRCSTCPTRSRRSGRRSLPPAARWPSTTPARSGWTPTCRSSCPRSTRPRRAPRPKGIISNPNCTTLSMIVALGALHARVRPRGARRRVLPGGLRRRAGRHRHAARADGQGRRVARPRHRAGRRPPRGRRPRAVPRAAGAQRRPVGRLAEGRRLVLRGAEGAQRVAQDPRPARPAGVGDLRARPRRHHPLARRARGLRARGRAVHARRRSCATRRAWCSATTRPPASSRRRPTWWAPTRPGSAGSAARWTTRTALDLFVCGDNLRKGAALNTAQIAELVAAELTPTDTDR